MTKIELSSDEILNAANRVRYGGLGESVQLVGRGIGETQPTDWKKYATVAGVALLFGVTITYFLTRK